MSQITTRIDQALGAKAPDVIIKNVRAFDVSTGEFLNTDIGISGNIITNIYGTFEGDEHTQIIDGAGQYAVPGFIDAHQHIESSLLTPFEQDRLVLPKGTTTIVWDPHEIANVLGDKAFDYAAASSQETITDVFWNISSCVPATELETSGAALEVDDLVKYKEAPGVIGLAEFMNIGGVAGKHENVIAKLEAFQGRHIDGHQPGVVGRLLDAMLVTGISTDHESTTYEEAKEKLMKGENVFVRHGSAAQNVPALAKLFNPRTANHMAFCTDDRNPLDIHEHGHIDDAIRTAIKHGADPESAYIAASYGAAHSFGLDKTTEKWTKRGKLGVGWQADIVLLSNFNSCTVDRVIKSGQLVTDSIFEKRKIVAPVGQNSVKLKEMSASDFVIKGDGEEVDVIGVIENQIVTEHLKAYLVANEQGELQIDQKRDILKMAVLERHGKNGNIGRGFIQGVGLKGGAIACSVGHDSHNVTVIGAHEGDMAAAVNRINEMQGGYVVVKDGQVVAEMALDMAGLMSTKPKEEVIEELRNLKEGVKILEPHMDEPFMVAAFMPLCVIPNLKLTDFGLTKFDPANGDNGPRLIQDQRPQMPALG